MSLSAVLAAPTANQEPPTLAKRAIARTVAVNNTKVYVVALASSTAGGSGYVDPTTLINITLAARSQYSSFGGFMLWKASQAWSAFSLSV